MPVIRLNWIMANCTREHDSDVRDKGEVKAPGATPEVNSMIKLKSTFSLVAVTENRSVAFLVLNIISKLVVHNQE